jgi:hypothetical protein
MPYSMCLRSKDHNLQLQIGILAEFSQLSATCNQVYGIYALTEIAISRVKLQIKKNSSITYSRD